MGYRSDVAITIYKKDFDELCNRIKNKTIADETRSELVSLLKWARIDIIKNKDDNNDSIVTMMFDSIKWYEGYEDVDYIMEFLRKSARCYSFKRIGESYDDYEEECDDSYELNYITYFERYFERDREGRLVSDAEKNEILGLMV